jgi:hypothetical protein
MGLVKNPALLAAVYQAALARVNDAPNRSIAVHTAIYHYFDQKYFVVNNRGSILRRDHAMAALVIRASAADGHRFTGSSHSAAIPGCDGLYCSLQIQALINEAAHYVENQRADRAARQGVPAPAPLPRSAVLYAKAAIEAKTLLPILAADFSPHNPVGKHFIDSLGNDPGIRSAMAAAGKGSLPLWVVMNDGSDYSVARGLGLAMAKGGYLALCVQTARTSERSAEELGDNLIFFGKNNAAVPNLSPVKAYLFPLVGPPQEYEVRF